MRLDGARHDLVNHRTGGAGQRQEAPEGLVARVRVVDALAQESRDVAGFTRASSTRASEPGLVGADRDQVLVVAVGRQRAPRSAAGRVGCVGREQLAGESRETDWSTSIAG